MERASPKAVRAEAFDLIRKHSDVGGLQRAIRTDFGVNLKRSEVEALQDYTRGVDAFQPGLRTAKREVASLSTADEGGGAVDFVGVGGRNYQATAKALAESQNMGGAIARMRERENAVTQSLVADKERLAQTSQRSFASKSASRRVQVTCSGDDCVVLGTEALRPEDQSNFVRALAELPREQRIRVRAAFVGAEIGDPVVRGQLANRGKDFIKILRGELRGRVDVAKLERTVLAVRLEGSDPSAMNLRLLVGATRSQFTTKDEKEIQEALGRALRMFNDNWKAKYGPGGYERIR